MIKSSVISVQVSVEAVCFLLSCHKKFMLVLGPKYEQRHHKQGLTQSLRDLCVYTVST